MKVELSNEEIIAMYELQDVINNNFNQDKQYGFDLDLDSFFLRCRNLKTQIYGLRVQAYLSTLLKYKPTPSSEDCGDFKTRENEDVEFKCSFLDNYSKNINIKNIRRWQDIDYYYVFTVDYSDYRNLIYKCYKLNRKQMDDECKVMNAQPVHSTKKANEHNEKIELGFSVKVGSDHFLRWEDNYLNKKFDLRKLSEERLLEIKSAQEAQDLLDSYKAEVERLKVDHPEEVAKRNQAIKERMELLQSKIDDVNLKKQTAKNKLIDKRRKAFDKIPKEILQDYIDRFNKKEFSKDYLLAAIDWEITKRFTRRKRRTNNKSLWTYPIHILTKRYYSGYYSYLDFQEEFKKRWEYINTEEYEKEQNTEEEIANIEEGTDEYFERKMRDCQKTSVY